MFGMQRKPSDDDPTEGEREALNPSAFVFDHESKKEQFCGRMHTCFLSVCALVAFTLVQFARLFADFVWSCASVRAVRACAQW